MFGQEVHVHEDGVVNGDVDVAVPDCDSAGAATEEFDGDAVELQQELYPLEGDYPSIVELVCLLRNFIGDLLQLVVEPAHGSSFDVLPQHALLFLLLGVFCGYFGACAAGRHGFLGRVVDLSLRVELLFRLAALCVLCVLWLYFDWFFQFFVSVTIAGWLFEGLLGLIGLIGLQAVGFAVFLVLPAVRLLGLRLLLRVVAFRPVVLGWPLLVAAFDLLLPLQVK